MTFLLYGCSGEEVLSGDGINAGAIETHVDHTYEGDNLGIDYSVQNGILTFEETQYTIIEVDGGDQNGERRSSVAVDIGYGDRVYWGLTNEHGQLVYVLADEIILQDDEKEPVNSSGRYYYEEAAVPGTGHESLDQGHVIADSLGGVANAYNITPQDSVLNRSGNQAYMEKWIRDADGCTNFVATITYEDTVTQIPSSYRFEYVLNGNTIIDEFPNSNPDQADIIYDLEEDYSKSVNEAIQYSEDDLSEIDVNGNGIVTIQEAKDAGYTMPITSEHWLYAYMKDGDGDGMVGE